jgi:hypothetical protein
MKPDYRFGPLAAALLGAVLGAVLGIRAVDTHALQNFYWLWLGVWVASGAVLGAAGGFILKLTRRD